MMKKFVVILAVLILLAGSVFGVETHVIKVRTTVEAKNPTFILKAGLTPESFDRAVSDDDSNNTLGWETVEKSIKEEDVVVFFEIVQKGDARQSGEKYSLTIEASEMTLKYNEDHSALSSDTDYKTTKGKISDITDITPSNGGKAIVSVSSVSTTPKGIATIEAEYNGRVEDGTPIAKFTVTWPKDINAPDGIYQASVVLKVSQQ